MKTQKFSVLTLSWILLAPLAAQNFSGTLTVSAGSESQSAIQISAVEKAQGAPDETAPAIAAQDLITLESRPQNARGPDSALDLTVLQKPSPFRSKVRSSAEGGVEIPAEDIKQGLDLISAVYRESGKPESNADCKSISLSVEHRVHLDVSTVLEIVETEIKANPSCCCEIVKSAIMASDADSDKVVSIVETAIIAAPETMRIVSQCAIAAMPESLAGVQALLAKYDAHMGEGESSKSAKGEKSTIDSKDAKGAVPDGAVPGDVAAMPNPLNFPGVGPVGPTPGGPGGQPLIPPVPPILITPPVTLVDP